LANAPKILGTDKLRQAYPKMNQAIDNANEALTKAVAADSKSSDAVNTANSVQEQFNQVVIEGDSSVEAAQARVKQDGTTYETLRDRLNDSDAHLAQKTSFTNENSNVILIAPFFRNNTDTNVYLYSSSDGKNFKKISDRSLFQARDSSMFYKNGYFHIAYTSYNPHDFSVKRSKNLRDWETFDIDLGLYNDTTAPRVWAPEWFEDDDGKLYIILSKQTGTQPDITGATIPSFQPYIVECTNLDTLTFSTPKLLNLESGNKIDGFIIKKAGVYRLFIKDDYDKKLEIWTSPNLTTWTKQTDEINVFDGDYIEGASIVLLNNTYFLYVDKHVEGFTYVTTSSDLVTFTKAVPLNIKDTNRHGTIIEVSDRHAKVILNDYINSNVPIDNNFTKMMDLGSLATNGIIATLTPRENMIYQSFAANGDIIINTVTNPYNIKKFFVTLRSGSTGSITFNTSANIELPTNLVISPSLGNADMVYEFVWVEDLSVFKVKGANPNKTLDHPKIKDGHTRINLNTLGASGSNFTNFSPIDGAYYVASANEQFTISGISTMPDGTRFFLSLNTTDSTANITLMTGTNLTVPNGSFVINVANERNELLYEVKKMAGTSFRLNAHK
jgi:hypothetical protein